MMLRPAVEKAGIGILIGLFVSIDESGSSQRKNDQSGDRIWQVLDSDVTATAEGRRRRREYAMRQSVASCRWLTDVRGGDVDGGWMFRRCGPSC